MGLRSAIQAAAQAAINATGDVAVSANYLSFTSATYNASAGTNVATYSTVAGVKIIIDVFTLKEMDGELVRPADKKALIPGQALGSVTPAENDQVVYDSVTWNVKEVMGDPADALWTLLIRKP